MVPVRDAKKSVRSGKEGRRRETAPPAPPLGRQAPRSGCPPGHRYRSGSFPLRESPRLRQCPFPVRTPAAAPRDEPDTKHTSRSELQSQCDYFTNQFGIYASQQALSSLFMKKCSSSFDVRIVSDSVREPLDGYPARDGIRFTAARSAMRDCSRVPLRVAAN